MMLQNRPAIVLFCLLALVVILYDGFVTQQDLSPVEKTERTGIVIEPPELNPYGQQIIVRDDLLKAKIKLSLKEPIHEISLGDTLVYTARLNVPTNYKNHGVFDYAAYLRHQGISYVAHFENNKNLKINYSGSKRWQESFYKKSMVLFKGFSPEVTGIMVALIWGDESYLTQETKDLFRRSGLYHLLVISGLHFTALLICVYYLSRKLIALKPSIYLKYPGNMLPAIAAIFVVSLYYLLCWPGASIDRAYIISVFICVAYLMRRQLDFLNLLFLAASLMLFVKPYVIYDLSFQFSFVAVLSLVLLVPRLTLFIPFGESRYRVLKLIRTLILATLAIFIGLTPLSVYYFHQIQLAGFVMNPWAVPMIEFLVTPLLILAFFTAPLSEFLATLIYRWCSLCLTGVLELMNKGMMYLPDESMVFPPHVGQLVLYYGCLLFCLTRFRRSFKISIIVMSVLMLTGFELLTYYKSKTHQDLRYHQIDVGQGDAAMLELPGGFKVMIDTGGSAYTDIAERALIPYFNFKRWRQLDALFLTHADLDHLGAAPELLKTVQVGQVYWNGKNDVSGTMDKLVATGVPMNVLSKHDVVTFGDCHILVLSPEGVDLISDNDASLVLKVVCPEAQVLLTGDLGSAGEYDLLRDNMAVLKSDLFKLGHHGSKNSNSFEFLKAVNPKMAVVSSKKNNHFGHPNPEVLKRLEDLQIPLIRTDQNGLIEVSIEKNSIQLY